MQVTGTKYPECNGCIASGSNIYYDADTKEWKRGCMNCPVDIYSGGEQNA